MGVEPFLVTGALNLVLAQRLARKACVECKVPVTAEPAALREVGFSEEQIRTAQLVKGKGCERCGGSGYKGRVALYEVMPMTDALKEMVLQGCSTAELKNEMIRQGIWTLRMSGIHMACKGVTTVDEITNCTAADRIG
jgi:type IV pilus assembly protein PilB